MPNPHTTEAIRLNKFISESGLTSRRKADELIANGQVKVNGKTTYELGVKVNPATDKVVVNGRPIKPVQNFVYYMFHKPRGVVTSMYDPEGRPTVADFFKKVKARVYPVGRLDWDTEGLLLMTNDGDFAHQVMHPRQKIPKAYLAKLNGQPTDDQLKKLRFGVTIAEGRVKAEAVERINKGSKQYDWVKIVVHEGKNRQVRKMFEKIGYDVTKLKRVSIGQLKLGHLNRGEYVALTPAQLLQIFTPRSADSHKKSPLRQRHKKAR